MEYSNAFIIQVLEIRIKIKYEIDVFEEPQLFRNASPRLKINKFGPTETIS